jgi:hypothetical protein
MDADERTVELKNNIGILTVSIPNYFDTAFSWTNPSDNKCSAYRMYRFANKKYNLVAEKGFQTSNVPDSLFQVTVQQLENSDCADTRLKIDTEYLYLRVEEYKTLQPKVTPIFQLMSINNRKYVVMERADTLEGLSNAVLSAETFINGQRVLVNYECIAQNCDSFITKMKNSLTTLRIE